MEWLFLQDSEWWYMCFRPWYRHKCDTGSQPEEKDADPIRRAELPDWREGTARNAFVCPCLCFAFRWRLPFAADVLATMCALLHCTEHLCLGYPTVQTSPWWQMKDKVSTSSWLKSKNTASRKTSVVAALIERDRLCWYPILLCIGWIPSGHFSRKITVGGRPSTAAVAFLLSPATLEVSATIWCRCL